MKRSTERIWACHLIKGVGSRLRGTHFYDCIRFMVHKVAFLLAAGWVTLFVACVPFIG